MRHAGALALSQPPWRQTARPAATRACTVKRRAFTENGQARAHRAAVLNLLPVGLAARHLSGRT